MSFQADMEASSESLEKLARLSPANPFYTSAYCEAMRALGYDPVLLSCSEGELEVSCSAFIKSGRLNRSLEITSMPQLPAATEFWQGLLNFCHEAKVSILEVNTFASRYVAIPRLGQETGRKHRIEFVLDLRDRELWKETRKGHRWSINRARKAGLKVEATGQRTACTTHAAMFAASMVRRKTRGESTPNELDIRSCQALIENGAGKLFQATLDGKVMSSALVLVSKTAAYYQTAGTSSEGMACGASHFLIFEIARALQEEGMELFNLGGTDRMSVGLQEFKSGFGTERVELEAAEFFLGNKVRRVLGVTLQLVRDSVEGLRSGVKN
jgi:lipid II:glycine glycyltransferase (peptidoglycan interpeptide bridge formation enzyme)